jgi:hypothetical protein
MSDFVCVVPVCPVRGEPSHRSEQVTQLLFGEAGAILEVSGDFVKIIAAYDRYEGWCQRTQLEVLESNLYVEETTLAGDWINEVELYGVTMRIPFGADLSFLVSGKATAAKTKFVFKGKTFQPKENFYTAGIVNNLANMFLNTPYLWGGKSVFGIDCSGFTQLVFKCMHIKLDRDAYQQAKQGEAIGFLQEAQTGDLAFFDNDAGKITHVGILLSATSIIHASGKVRIDSIDNVGIISSDTGKRTHKLRVIKRINS